MHSNVQTSSLLALATVGTVLALPSLQAREAHGGHHGNSTWGHKAQYQGNCQHEVEGLPWAGNSCHGGHEEHCKLDEHDYGVEPWAESLRFVYTEDIRVAAFSDAHHGDKEGFEVRCSGEFLGYLHEDGYPIVEDGREICTSIRFKEDKEVKCIKAVHRCDDHDRHCDHPCDEEQHDNECCQNEHHYPHCWEDKHQYHHEHDYGRDDHVIAYDWAECKPWDGPTHPYPFDCDVSFWDGLQSVFIPYHQQYRKGAAFDSYVYDHEFGSTVCDGEFLGYLDHGCHELNSAFHRRTKCIRPVPEGWCEKCEYGHPRNATCSHHHHH